MRVRAFADLAFHESAGLCLARALERAHVDVTADHPEAWVVEERRISFHLDAELSIAEVEAHRRLLTELLREALEGEAVIDREGQLRWAQGAGTATSGVPGGAASGPVSASDEPQPITIPTGTK